MDAVSNEILPPLADGATLVLQQSITIERPAAEVWAFVRDMENYPLWFFGITQMKGVDDQPVATLGKRYHETAITPGGGQESIGVEIVAADEQRYHLAIQASLQPFLPRFDYRVVAVSNTSSVFHWRSVATGQSFKARWQRPIFQMILRKRLARSLDNFRRILEARPDEIMRAAMFWRFGEASDALIVFDRAARPVARKGEIVVRQVASSINHIDCHRRRGYGRNAMRVRGALHYPVTLGNDVAGVVDAVGPGVTRFAVGDAVVAVKPPSSTGAFADYVAVSAVMAVAKPASLDFADAAALPYTFYTAWCALFHSADLTRENAVHRSIFVQGGAGGVGSMAIQIAKYLGARVAASCAPGQVELVHSLGVDDLFVHGTDDYAAVLRDVDIALCTATADEEDRMLAILKRGGRYSTVIHPTLAMTDHLGLLKGFMASKKLLKAKNKALAPSGRKIGWTLFKVDPAATALFAEMLERGALRAVIDREFPFDQIVAAQERLESGQATGKIIVTF
jgi:reticulon-4-interacting protein 1, mitochondrial